MNKLSWPGILSFLHKKEALEIEELSSDSETTKTQQGMQRQQHMIQKKTSAAMETISTDSTTGEQQMISSNAEQVMKVKT